jgi:Rieske Fe-S protein
MNQPPSLPPPRCIGCLESSSKRVSLKTLAGAALALGSGLHGAHAEDDLPRAGDWLVGVDDDAAKPITPADLKIDEKQLIVFPFDSAAKRARSNTRLNRILLIKLDPASLDAETTQRAAEGVLAYSAICTHQACDVNSWRPKEKTLLCFCHFSQFQPAEGASVVAGPAPRPLPWLPLKVDGGKLVIAGSFSEAPGGGG